MRSTLQHAHANYGTHCSEWECSHRLHATSKGLHANLRANLLTRPVWTGPKRNWKTKQIVEVVKKALFDMPRVTMSNSFAAALHSRWEWRKPPNWWQKRPFPALPHGPLRSLSLPISRWTPWANSNHQLAGTYYTHDSQETSRSVFWHAISSAAILVTFSFSGHCWVEVVLRSCNGEKRKPNKFGVINQTTVTA